jgi:hypothetical protein
MPLAHGRPGHSIVRRLGTHPAQGHSSEHLVVRAPGFSELQPRMRGERRHHTALTAVARRLSATGAMQAVGSLQERLICRSLWPARRSRMKPAPVRTF